MNLRRAIAPLMMVSLVSFTGLASLPGCSTDEPTASADDNGAVPGETVTVVATAAEGGTVSDSSGSVVLSIPPGALAEDTTITVTVKARSEATIAAIYDFAPDGLTFLKPVSLRIKAKVPDGKSAAVALETGGAWAPLPGSVVDAAAGTVTASTDHFSHYSVIIVDGQAVIEPSATCAEALGDFVPCGGDVTGSWQVSMYCFPSQETEDLFQGGCDEGTIAVEHSTTRTVNFNGGVFTHGAGRDTTKMTADIPQACLTRSGGGTCRQLEDCFSGADADCEQVDGRTASCSEAADGCTCVVTTTEREKSAETDRYTTSGTTLTISSDNYDSIIGEYCVSGDHLWFKQTGGERVLFIADRR